MHLRLHSKQPSFALKHRWLKNSVEAIGLFTLTFLSVTYHDFPVLGLYKHKTFVFMASSKKQYIKHTSVFIIQNIEYMDTSHLIDCLFPN